jgi:PAS domain S-box-containing protein
MAEARFRPPFSKMAEAQVDTPHFLEDRINREVASRKEAERLRDVTSLELSARNREVRSSTGRLHEQLELSGVMLDAVPDVVMTCDEDYRIETVNRACADMLGYLQAECVGALLTGVIPALVDYQKTLARDAFVIADIPVLKRDGDFIDAELRGKRTRLSGKPLMVIILHDISGRKSSAKMKDAIYRQLHEARRLEAVGTLASGIAHELNTPIQFIGDNVKFIGHSLEKIHASYLRYDALKLECKKHGLLPKTIEDLETFNRDIELPALVAEIQAAMRETMEGVKQVRDMVLLMREFAHPGTGSLEPTDINGVIKSALTICRGRTRNVVSVEADLFPGMASLLCNRGQIQQVLLNLIVNAVEAIEENGSEDGRIRVATTVEGADCRIEISDNGAGVPSKLRGRIFDPFFTTKSVGRGTGQGLALAKDIVVTQHGGRLYLDDRPGFSTSFIIELPFNPPAARTGETGQNARA